MMLIKSARAMEKTYLVITRRLKLMLRHLTYSNIVSPTVNRSILKDRSSLARKNVQVWVHVLAKAKS